MRLSSSIHKVFSLALIILWAASCTPKTKTEQPVEKTDSVKQAIPKAESSPTKESIAEKPAERAQEKPRIAEKKNKESAPVKPEEKIEPAKKAAEPAKEPAKEPVVITPQAKDPVVAEAPVKQEEKKNRQKSRLQKLTHRL